MVIRPMNAVHAMGEFGRSTVKSGAKGGPASFYGKTADMAVFGQKAQGGAGLYSAAPLFKIMGAVELMSEEYDGGRGVGERAALL